MSPPPPPPPAATALPTARPLRLPSRLRTAFSPHGSASRIAIACIALCVTLRSPFFGAALNIDEGGDALVAAHWFSGHGSVYGSYWLDRPPLLLLLYRVALFGGQLGVRMLGCAVAAVMIWCVVQMAKRLGGARAATIAGVLAALFASQTILGAIFSDAELLAAAPSAASMLLLLMAMRDERSPTWLLAGSGLLGSCALLIKQSSIEVLAAGAVLFAASAFFERRHWIGWRSVWAWGAGVVSPIVAVVLWAHFESIGLGHFLYAMFGFRLDGLAFLQTSSATPIHRLLHTGLPVLFGTGLGLLLIWALVGLWQRRNRRVETTVLLAWMGFAVVGLLGGGNYWPHYFIQLIPVLCVLGAAPMAQPRYRWRAHVCVGFIVAITGIFTVGGITIAAASPPQQEVLTVADYLHTHANPQDTVYVMYARANLVYYAGLPSPFPYNWSLMDQALPQAQQQLRTYLKSPKRRPVWLVEWQPPSDFDLDSFGSTDRLVAANYHLVATVCGRNIYLRDDHTMPAYLPQQTVDCSASKLATGVLELGYKFGFVPAHNADSVQDQLDYVWS